MISKEIFLRKEIYMVGFKLKQGEKNVVLINGFHCEHAKNSLDSPGIKYYRRNPLISIVVCWFTHQANSSSRSNTQYFNPLCNKTYKIPLALPLFLKKMSKILLNILHTEQTNFENSYMLFYNILTMSLEKFEFPPVYQLTVTQCLHSPARRFRIHARAEASIKTTA